MLARYFPLETGLYEVAPGLFPLGHDFGNGDLDQKIFQIESDFSKFRSNKLIGREERVSKYHLSQSLSENVRKEAVQFLMHRLASEWPQHFSIQRSGPEIHLTSQLTQESFVFDEQGNLLGSKSSLNPRVSDSLEALGLLIPEDIAILTREKDQDRLSFLHLFSPSHWAAEDKIGLSFFDIHQPIPMSRRLTLASPNLVQAMIHRGPFVRFVWSFVTDERLNHHPEPPPGQDPSLWKGRSFDSSKQNPFYLRIERQITYGLPQVESALFFIKISFWSGLEIKMDPRKRDLLISALNSMTPESRAYKGVKECFDDLVGWL